MGKPDLDAATKRTIDRGRRNLEVLKQPQYSPYTVGDQIAIILKHFSHGAETFYFDTHEFLINLYEAQEDLHS